MATELTIIAHYGDGSPVTILGGRMPTQDELSDYADWYKPVAIYADTTQDRIELPQLKLQDLVEHLGPSTHSLPGCDNRVWIIDPSKAAELRALAESRHKDDRYNTTSNPPEHSASQREQDYDNIHNEGGDGYNPHRAGRTGSSN